MKDVFEYQTYRVEYESHKDHSARLGQAFFTANDANGTLAFMVDAEVTHLASIEFWQGRDEEEVAVEEGRKKVEQLIDEGNFVRGKHYPWRAQSSQN